MTQEPKGVLVPGNRLNFARQTTFANLRTARLYCLFICLFVYSAFPTKVVQLVVYEDVVKCFQSQLTFSGGSHLFVWALNF